MGDLVLKKTTTGQITLTPQDVAGNQTITFPATTGTVALLSGGVLPVSQGGTGTSTALTTGSVVFAGASGVYSQDNSNLYWDDTNNYLGIGTNSPSTYSALLAVKASDRPAISYFGGTTYAVRCGANASIATVEGVDAATGNTSYQPLQIGGSFLSFATAGAERMRVNAGAPILCLAGGNTSATGTGIAFPATQSQSSDVNTLDDYEEGTWTPNLLISSSSTGITYSSRNGTYTKIGNTVRCTFVINLSNKGSNTGGINVTNLPFTPSNPTDARNIGVAAFEGATSSFPAACVWALFYDDGRVYLRYQSASSFSDILGTNLTNTTVIYATCVYLTTQ